MAQLRTLITEDSMWRFNVDEMMYRRTALSELSSERSAIPYTGEWEPYEKLVPCEGGTRFLVHRPVPWGTGARRNTGVVLVDFFSTLDDNGVEVNFERNDPEPAA